MARGQSFFFGIRDWAGQKSFRIPRGLRVGKVASNQQQRITSPSPAPELRSASDEALEEGPEAGSTPRDRRLSGKESCNACVLPDPESKATNTLVGQSKDSASPSAKQSVLQKSGSCEEGTQARSQSPILNREVDDRDDDYGDMANVAYFVPTGSPAQSVPSYAAMSFEVMTSKMPKAFEYYMTPRPIDYDNIGDLPNDFTLLNRTDLFDGQQRKLRVDGDDVSIDTALDVMGENEPDGYDLSAVLWLASYASYIKQLGEAMDRPNELNSDRSLVNAWLLIVLRNFRALNLIFGTGVRACLRHFGFDEEFLTEENLTEVVRIHWYDIMAPDENNPTPQKQSDLKQQDPDRLQRQGSSTASTPSINPEPDAVEGHIMALHQSEEVFHSVGGSGLNKDPFIVLKVNTDRIVGLPVEPAQQYLFDVPAKDRPQDASVEKRTEEGHGANEIIGASAPVSSPVSAELNDNAKYLYNQILQYNAPRNFSLEQKLDYMGKLVDPHPPWLQIGAESVQTSANDELGRAQERREIVLVRPGATGEVDASRVSPYR